jgi:hypothetical protein
MLALSKISFTCSDPTSPPCHPRFVFLPQSPLNAAQRRDQVVIISADAVRVHLQLFWQRVNETLEQDRIAGRALQLRQTDGEVLQTLRQIVDRLSRVELSTCSAARTNVVFTNSYVDNNSSLISE